MTVVCDADAQPAAFLWRGADPRGGVRDAGADHAGLADLRRQKRIDRVVYILCALAFAVSTFIVLRTELVMFLSGGGAA